MFKTKRILKGYCAHCGAPVLKAPFARWYNAVMCRGCWEEGHYFTAEGEIKVRAAIVGKVVEAE